MKPNKKRLVGLTGTIASGKSTVAAYLKSRFGIPTVDADAVNREVLEEEETKERLREAFGDAVFGADGSVDRKALAAVVFGDAEKLKSLTDISWPRILDRIRTWAEQQDGSIVLVEAIDLLKTSMRSEMDEIWVVFAPVEERVRRMTENRAMTEEEARARIASQWSDEVYLEQAARVIRSDGSLRRLYRDARRAVRAIRRK